MGSERVLLIDDEPMARKTLAAVVAREGVDVVEAGDAAAALAAIAAAPAGFDMVFLDFQLPDMSGLELLPKLMAEQPGVPVAIITGHGGSDLAVRAMQLGAVDFVEKPFDVARIRACLRQTLEASRLRRRLADMEKGGKGPFDELVTRSPAMIEVFRMIERVKDLPTTVLILGESGTGKELIARALHRASKRARGPFVVLNCAAIPGPLLESELFGSEKGAYTGADQRREGKIAQADSGTLFLDEIGDLPADLQAKLLRVLQERTVTPLGGHNEKRIDVRFVAATHQDLEAKVRAGTFREDLFFRLNQFPVMLPPLRSRREDIPLLVEHFVRKARSEGIPVASVLPGALELLESHDWPGNVRELENAVWRAAILAEGGAIAPEHLPSALLRAVQVRSRAGEPMAAVSALIPEWTSPEDVWPLARIEREAIRAALAVCGGNLTEVARRLDIGRATLYRKLEEYGLEKPD